MSSRLITKLVIVLLVLLAAFFLYRRVFLSSPVTEAPGLQALSEADGLSGASPKVDDEFIRLLERLQGVELNSDLFNSPAWGSLVNFQVPLEPESKGRRNPFSPVGLDFASSTSSTTPGTPRGR